MTYFREMLDEVGMSPAEFFAGLVALMCVLFVAFCCWALAGAISKTNQATVSSSGYASTFRHDGHLFVRASGGGLLHHPDCQCGAR